MTTTQEIIWTALPWGHADDGRPRLTAYPSARLRTDVADPTLAEFPNFVTWPAFVNAMTFTVKAKAEPAAVPTTRLSAAADATLWGQLFTKKTFVRPFEFKDHSLRNLRSFPVESVMTYLSSLYQELAQLSPDDLPLIEPEDGGDPKGTLAGLIEELGGVLWHYRIPHGERGQSRFREEALSQLEETTGFAWDDKKGLAASAKEFARNRRYRALDGAFASSRVVDSSVAPSTFGFASKTAMDFYQAHRFFDRPENEAQYLNHPDAGLIPPSPEVPKLDFHQAVAIFGDYPRLLRRLGLAIDLAVDGELPAMGDIRVIPQWGAGHPASGFSVDRTPWTRFELSDDLFVAQPQDASRIDEGMIALDGASDDFEGGGTGSRFGVVQVDPDGAALKTVATAVNLNSLLADKEQERVAFDMSDRTGVAPMRSVGMAVFAKDRAVALHADLADAAVQDTSTIDDLVFFAEHLARGYRVDVFDAATGPAGTWRSLCQRVGRYVVHLAGGGTVELKEPDGQPITDEGYIKAASTSSADDQASDLYLHETMFRWDGWSLVTKRPGRTIIPKPSAGGIHQDEEPGVPPLKLETSFRLETSFEPVSGSLPRLRFGREYKFRARAVDLAGNSIDPDASAGIHASETIFFGRFDPINPPVIVPRSELTEGESVEQMVIRSNYDQTTGSYVAGTAYAAANERHVVPPKTSQELAERHGAFDMAFGPTGSPGSQYAIAVREAATLEHTHVVTAAGPPPAYQPVTGSQMIPGSVPPDAPPGAEAQGAYLINTEPLFPVAYLPDVLAAGVAFRGLPGADPIDLRAYAGTWPNLKPILLRIEESPGTVSAGLCAEKLDVDPKPPLWNATTRVLTVYLPKAMVAVVRYSSYPTDLAPMAAWRRWMDGSSVDKAHAASGGHWMLTPFRELRLVHAVQQPLCPPSVRLDAWRHLGETFARLTGMTYLSVKSTGQLDIGAAWWEPVDSLSDAGPKDIQGFGHVASIRVDADLPEPEPFPPAAPLPDGTTPWQGEGGLPLPFPDLQKLPKPYQVTDPKADGYLKPHELLDFVRGDVRHEFGDTKHRWVKYRLTGTTRFREYFPASVTADQTAITRVGDEVLVNILSSARPDAPRIRYIVPSWQWEQEPVDPTSWTKFRRTRVGGGLRVWMDRPWYSSGEGEKLAVVLLRPGDTLNERTSKRVSQFGKDPAWDSATPQPTLTQASFANAVDADANLGLAEAPGGQLVNVVAFDPEYDLKSRHLWFCDVDMSPKANTSYYPFVRLALARYQRHSIGWDTKLSPVIQTDFHQLVPSRTLTLTLTGPHKLDVTLHGPAPDAPIRNRVEVTIEHHDGAIPGDLGWRIVPGTQPVHLSDGAPDVSWIPPKIPRGFVTERDLRVRAEGRERTGARIRRSSVPLIDAAEAAMALGVGSHIVEGFKPLPVFVLPGYELWSGSVTIPDDPALGRLRLVVREFEHYRADPDVGRLDTDLFHDPHIDGPFLDRIVYADIVELPAGG